MASPLFRKLSESELAKFAKWARDNYRPGNEISEVWHPAVRAECERMNLEDTQAHGREEKEQD